MSHCRPTSTRALDGVRTAPPRRPRGPRSAAGRAAVAHRPLPSITIATCAGHASSDRCRAGSCSRRGPRRASGASASGAPGGTRRTRTAAPRDSLRTRGSGSIAAPASFRSTTASDCRQRERLARDRRRRRPPRSADRRRRPCPARTAAESVAPQTAHAVSEGWNPESESSFSMKDSATAPGSRGPASRAPDSPASSRSDEPDVPLVLLRDLVDRLEHRLAGREQREVLADRQCAAR